MTSTYQFSIRASRSIAIVALLFACAAGSGCYKRVVGVQGPGSDAMNVYEPNLKDPVKDPYTDPAAYPTKKYNSK
jgi:hypothetical protein